MCSYQNSFCNSIELLQKTSGIAILPYQTKERKLGGTSRFWRRKHFEPYKLDWQQRITLVSIFYPRQLVILHIQQYSIAQHSTSATVFDMLPPVAADCGVARATAKLHFFATFLALCSRSVLSQTSVCVMRTKALDGSTATHYSCLALGRCMAANYTMLNAMKNMPHYTQFSRTTERA